MAENQAGSSGGGIYGYTDPSLVYFYNSLLGDNSPDDADGHIHSEDYNLIENCSASVTGTTTNDIYGQDPQLDVFDYYDADTRTFKLLPVSPAVDAANDTVASETDQRNKYRWKTADIGAHEYLGTDTYIWDGQGGSGSWFDVSLWSGNFLPSDQTAATVRNGDCNVDQDKGEVYDLTIESTATLNINLNDTIVSGGDIINLSSSPTGEGRFLLDGNAGEEQSLKGKFGMFELDNLYGVIIDSLVELDDDVVLHKIWSYQLYGSFFVFFLTAVYFFYAQYEGKKYTSCTSCQIGNIIGSCVIVFIKLTLIMLASYFFINPS
jgi:hypothetical protein